jgi:hypothetical protein
MISYHDKIVSDIIAEVSNMNNVISLDLIYRFTRNLQKDTEDEHGDHEIKLSTTVLVPENVNTEDEHGDHEIKQRPMTLIEIANEFDIQDIIKMLDTMKYMEGLKSVNAYQQMFKAFSDVLDKYTGAEERR